jgi:hypothetical protein
MTIATVRVMSAARGAVSAIAIRAESAGTVAMLPTNPEPRAAAYVGGRR